MKWFGGIIFSEVSLEASDAGLNAYSQLRRYAHIVYLHRVHYKDIHLCILLHDVIMCG